MPEKVEKKPEKKPAKKKSKVRVTDTHIKHHRNGSHTMSHDVEGGGEPISYAAPDLDAVKAGLDEHVVGSGTEEAAAPNPVMDKLGSPTPAAG